LSKNTHPIVNASTGLVIPKIIRAITPDIRHGPGIGSTTPQDVRSLIAVVVVQSCVQSTWISFESMRSHPNNQTGGGVTFAAESLVRFSNRIILPGIITLLPVGEIVRVSAYNKE
jgi:hypothetical protein